jgi:hypothetical protein
MDESRRRLFIPSGLEAHFALLAQATWDTLSPIGARHGSRGGVLVHQQRRHPRVRSQALFCRLHVGGAVRPACKLENLSRGGAFVRTFDAVPMGSHIVVEFVRSSSRKELRLSARVCSVVGAEEAHARQLLPGIGISFEANPAKAEARFRELLQEVAPGAAVLDGDVEVDGARPGTRSLPGRSNAKPLLALPAGFTTDSSSAPTRRADSSVAEAPARLAVDLTLLQHEVEEGRARITALEDENRKLRDELMRAQRAIFQLKHR